MTDFQKLTQSTYGTIACEYLEQTRNRSSIQSWIDRFSQQLPDNARVLDVGSGPGFDCSEFRRRGKWALALDLSYEMLHVGRHDYPGPRVQANVEKLPFPADAFDGAWANASLLHLPKDRIGLVFGELRRVLRSPGLLHVAVKDGLGAATETGRFVEPRWYQYWAAADLDAALAAAGYTVVDEWAASTSRSKWIVRIARVSSD